MPNIKSAMKRMKTSEQRHLRNQSVKSRISTIRRQLYEAIASGDRNRSTETLKRYFSALDKAAKKGMIATNNASRRKSRAAARLKRELPE